MLEMDPRIPDNWHMRNDIKIITELGLGTNFVAAPYLQKGKNEYSIRNQQLTSLGKSPKSYRKLKTFEIESLVRNHNTCSDWSLFLVTDPFVPELIHNNVFSGLIRIGKLERVALEHHDLHLFAGINNSKIIACDIGDNCVISNSSYIAHYIIGDNCILLDNAEIHASNHAKFGNSIVMEGEDESVRITIDVMNEQGGRWVYPFEDMNCADAYLWARFRDRPKLMEQFIRMTDTSFPHKRGRYGVIGHSSVLKSNRVIKDVMIGESAYIKGSNKLKNLTIKSREEARTQIGEGVELINGIVGYRCRIFYGCKAVRFIMRDNSELKYGARLIHSILGENSTVSCCEMLNNLIYPAHEQHHNTSFLISTLVKGQSNIAAGATIGSNHNSRAPDGEIEAGRGFWPGLCTSLKHSSKFASFCLLSKSDYRYELNIPFPFSLIDNDYRHDRLVINPAYWWTINLYALMRNEIKFKSRDRRINKKLAFEYSPFAPDTAQECLTAMALLEELTGDAAMHLITNGTIGNPTLEKIIKSEVQQRTAIEDSHETAEQKMIYRKIGRAVILNASDPLPFTVKAPGVEHSERECIIYKPVRAWRAYREILLWFAVRTVSDYAIAHSSNSNVYATLATQLAADTWCCAETTWENIGGILVSDARLNLLLEKTEQGMYPTWAEFHQEYESFSDIYPLDKARYAWAILQTLYQPAQDQEKTAEKSDSVPRKFLIEALLEAEKLCSYIETGVTSSRAKDYTNPFRLATYRSKAEMEAVLGRLEENPFITHTKNEMAKFKKAFSYLRELLSHEG